MKKLRNGRASGPQLTRLAAMLASSAFATLLGSNVHAQSQAPSPATPATDAAPAEKDELGLGKVVVTATSGAKTKLKSSVSVTTVDSDLVQALNPQTQAEVLKLIPGMVGGDGAGPGGNSNFSVRGLPVTTGGAPFVQIQEDGLPTVLFGDMNFGNNDYWIRFDRSNVIEAVRGGSASTLASGAPGAVLNYITDNGAIKGGEIGLEQGLGYRQSKLNFNAGGPLADGLRYHVEGFVTEGAGVRDEGFNASRGYQLKANVTKDLADGLGFVRLNVKLLDDREPLYTSYPALLSANGSGVTGMSPYPGFDPRNGSAVGVYNQAFTVLNSSSGTFNTVPADGVHPVANAWGAQVHLTPGNDLTIDDKFRFTNMKGTFSTQFMGLTPTANVIGSKVNGQTVGSVVYATGPNAGKSYTGTYLNAGTQIYTNMSDMGSIVNDLSVSKVFKLGGDKLTASGGLFHMSQTIAQDWHPNSQYQSLDGRNPANLNLFTGANGTGQALTINGVSGYNTAWGASVDRAYNINATNDAPYLNLNWEKGPLQLDAGLRKDYLHVTGWAESASAATSVNKTVNGVSVATATLDPSTTEALHYGASYNSYTLGALYLLDSNTSVFLRGSQGGRFNVDRNILSGYTNADGSLNASGAQKVVSIVKQEEIGLKHKGRFGDTSYGVNATLFYNTYGSSNFDLTQGTNGTYFEDKYKSTGLELEGQLRHGGFALVGNLTYTQAKIVANATAPGGTTPLVFTNSGVGNQPAYTPALTYMIAPSYSVGPVQAGFMVVGTGRMNMNNSSEYWAPGTTLVHMNFSWEFAPNATITLNVHNVFNTLSAAGNAGAGSLSGLQGNPSVNGQYVSAISAVNGRSAVLGLNYAF